MQTVLIIMMLAATSQSGKSISVAMFDTPEACQAAKDWVHSNQNGKGGEVIAECFSKRTGK